MREIFSDRGGNGEKVDLFQIPEEIKDINNKETPIIISKDES